MSVNIVQRDAGIAGKEGLTSAIFSNRSHRIEVPQYSQHWERKSKSA